MGLATCLIAIYDKLPPQRLVYSNILCSKRPTLVLRSLPRQNKDLLPAARRVCQEIIGQIARRGRYPGDSFTVLLRMAGSKAIKA